LAWEVMRLEAKNAVLIIDDDPALLKMAGEILKDYYAVSCVKSGYEAVVLLQTDYMPDIILLDIDMPGLSGFDTMTALREMEDMQDIPIVFLTGVTKMETELKGLSCGAVDYITKPFIKEILLARLKVHLESGKRLRQLSMTEINRQEIRIDEEIFEQISAGLSDTEKKILRLIALGYTNQEIGEALCYSYNYVKKVVGTIYEKKYVSKRSELKKLFL
jgi:DNA-binding response OmpR family regulator